MKKINLTIANPCHENWDAMTTSEKGKFCSSCQKTVVDFTTMNDREIIEYFKKTKDSVCGRLTDEQLSKDLVIPSKPIPWVKYFFRITFPAFIMSLKSCTPNTESKQRVTKSYNLSKPKSASNSTVMGDTTLASVNNERIQCTMGVVVGEIAINIDSSKITRPEKPKKTSVNKNKVPFKPIPKIDSIQFPIVDSIQFHPVTSGEIKDFFNPDQVLVGHLGGISSTSIKVIPKPISIIKKIADTINVFSATPKITLFPNPITSNSQLNIKLNNIKKSDYLFSLITSSGIIIQNQEVKIDTESNVINIGLKSLLPGTYIVRMVDRKSGKSISQKLIVL